MSPSVERHRTALHRNTLSRPVTLAIQDSIIGADTTVLDYGCGRGADVRLLAAQGIRCGGWDPVFAPHEPKAPSDIVTLSYVVNVIEDPHERGATLRSAWELARSTLVVSARLSSDVRNLQGVEWSDGLVTRSGTFQKLYTQDELRSWIQAELGVPPIPTAPGVFYVFRDDIRAQTFLASRFRRRVATPKARVSDVLYGEFRPLFEQLIEFISERGRLPRPDELPAAKELAERVGGLGRAFAIVKRVTGADRWDPIVKARLQDLLVYIALSRFGHRPRLSQLPQDLRYDIQDFFGNYLAACRMADELLTSAGNLEAINAVCQESPIGKLTPNALYVHISALPRLDPLLRVYEGCARVLSGSVHGANIVKLHRQRAQVSYLGYPDFDTRPHPGLALGARIRLSKLQTEFTDYRGVPNPPILHRKELFVADDYPGREKFASLTAAEERAGLYQSTESIGYRDQWETLLKARELRLRGHRLVRTAKSSLHS